MAWKQIAIDQIPVNQTNKVRNSWKPDVDDVSAVFGLVLSGGEALIQKMSDSNAAHKKAEAMLKWMKTQALLPATMTAFSRGDHVVVTDIELMQSRDGN